MLQYNSSQSACSIVSKYIKIPTNPYKAIAMKTKGVTWLTRLSHIIWGLGEQVPPCYLLHLSLIQIDLFTMNLWGADPYAFLSPKGKALCPTYNGWNLATHLASSDTSKHILHIVRISSFTVQRSNRSTVQQFELFSRARKLLPSGRGGSPRRKFQRFTMRAFLPLPTITT